MESNIYVSIKLFYYSIFDFSMAIRNWRSKNIRSKQCSISRVPKTRTQQTVFTETFNQVGAFEWTAPKYCDSIEYLVVGGGGGGGGTHDNAASGGGGGGQVVQGIIKSVPYCCKYSIQVGAGGAGGLSVSGPNNSYDGSNGSPSQFDIYNASGGHGGYSSRHYIGGVSGRGALNPTEGGAGGGGGGAGGGGGGSAVKGNDRIGTVGGTGGAGTVGTLTGNTYGVGGNGGDRSVLHYDIISNANSVYYVGDSGATNTGNGGHGSNTQSSSNRNGGAGGSGIVVIRYTIGSHYY